MKKILSYGALVTENLILKDKIQKLENTAKLLLEESCLQSKVIGQLKQLNKSQLINVTKTKPNQTECCTRGHFQCKINHARYSLVNKLADTKTNKFVAMKSPLPILREEKSFFTRLSKQIDRLQNKYGVPSELSREILVASCDVVFLENPLIPTLATPSSYKKKEKKYRRRYKTVVVVARPPPPLLLPRHLEPKSYPSCLPNVQDDTWTPRDEGNSSDDEYDEYSNTGSTHGQLKGHSVDEFNGNDGEVFTNGTDEECDEVDTPVFDSNVDEVMNVSRMDDDIAASITDSVDQDTCYVAADDEHLSLTLGGNSYTGEMQVDFAPHESIECAGDVLEDTAPYDYLEDYADGDAVVYSADGDAVGYSFDGDADGYSDFYDGEYDSY